MAVLLYLVILLASCIAEFNSQQVTVRPDLGVTLTKIHTIDPCNEVHKLALKIRMPEPPMSLPSVELCKNLHPSTQSPELLEACRLLNHATTTTNMVRQTLVEALNQAEETRIALDVDGKAFQKRIILNPHGNHHNSKVRLTNPKRYRPKRNIFTRLLGAVSYDDLEKHKKVVFSVLRAHDSKLKDLQFMQDTLVATVDGTNQDLIKLKDLARKQVDSLDKVIYEINQQTAIVGNISQRLENDHTYYTTVNRLVIKLINEGLLFNQIITWQAYISKSFLRSVQNLAHHILDVSLINFPSFLNHVKEIGKKLDREQSQFQISSVALQPEYYLTEKVASYFRHHHDLYVIIDIPLSFRKFTTFQLFNIKTYPVTLSTKPSNSTTVWTTQIQPNHKYIAVNKEGQYLLLKEETLKENCKGEQYIKCQVYPQIYNHGHLTCESALLLNNVYEVYHLCPSSMTLLKISSPIIVPIAPNTFFVVNHDSNLNITETCQHKLEQYPKCTQCIINIHCHCSVFIKETTISASYDACTTQNDTINGTTVYTNTLWRLLLHTQGNILSESQQNWSVHLPHLLNPVNSANISYYTPGSSLHLTDIQTRLKQHDDDLTLDDSGLYLTVDDYAHIHQGYTQVYIITVVISVVSSIVVMIFTTYISRKLGHAGTLVATTIPVTSAAPILPVSQRVAQIAGNSSTLWTIDHTKPVLETISLVIIMIWALTIIFKVAKQLYSELKDRVKNSVNCFTKETSVEPNIEMEDQTTEANQLLDSSDSTENSDTSPDNSSTAPKYHSHPLPDRTDTPQLHIAPLYPTLPSDPEGVSVPALQPTTIYQTLLEDVQAQAN